MIFKLKYGFFDLYTSMTLHQALGDSDIEQFIENIKTSLPRVIQLNMKEEYKLKKNCKSFRSILDENLKTHATIQKQSSAKVDLEVAAKFYEKGFKRIKFKTDISFFNNHTEYLNLLTKNKDLEIIFDFNSSATAQDFEGMNWPSEIIERSYWEDPISLDSAAGLLQLKNLGYKLILDQKNMANYQELKPLIPLFDIVAVKPTKESVIEISKVFPKTKLMITTNMGDELDHVISAYWANYVYKNFSARFFGAGLYTRHFFTDSSLDYSAYDKESEPMVKASFAVSTDTAFGWGLDDQLSKLEWTFLKDTDFEF